MRQLQVRGVKPSGHSASTTHELMPAPVVNGQVDALNTLCTGMVRPVGTAHGGGTTTAEQIQSGHV